MAHDYVPHRRTITGPARYLQSCQLAKCWRRTERLTERHGSPLEPPPERPIALPLLRASPPPMHLPALLPALPLPVPPCVSRIRAVTVYSMSPACGTAISTRSQSAESERDVRSSFVSNCDLNAISISRVRERRPKLLRKQSVVGHASR